MTESKLYVSSPVEYQNIQNETRLEKENFQNSQNIFDLIDSTGKSGNKDGILDEEEINAFLSNIDASDGSMDGALDSATIARYVENSNYDENTKAELADFLNQIYSLTQETEAGISIYSTIDTESENKNTVADGKIDNFSQGVIGDCWLLAQTKAISGTSEGSELIYNSIKTDGSGNYLVSFDGVGEDIQITNEEFQEALASEKYSSGDADALLLEIAVEKYLIQNQDNNNKAIDEKISLSYSPEVQEQSSSYSILNGNQLTNETSLQYLLEGQTGTTIDNGRTELIPSGVSSEDFGPNELYDSSINTIYNLLYESAQNSSSSAAFICSFNTTNTTANLDARITNNHAYELNAFINDNGELMVSLTDPHYTSVSIYLTFEDFSKVVNQVGIIQI